MLIVVSGLPGTGKTTLARALARRWTATWLRIDTIEQALRSSTGMPAGAAGYAVAQALAAANLALGATVVVDCVNPVAASRTGWRAVAPGAALVEVELVCSDPVEHRRRVERRLSDIPGLVVPDWASVEGQPYEPWPEPHVGIDTAGLAPDAVLEAVERAIEVRLAPPAARRGATTAPVAFPSKRG